MTGTAIFKKAIFFSLLGHMVVFSIFSLSFGRRIRRVDYAEIAFWGTILRNSELTLPVFQFKPRPGTQELGRYRLTQGYPQVKNDEARTIAFSPTYYFKPATSLALNSDKMILVHNQVTPPSAAKEKKSPIMFYPHLPHHFLLYFKDRESVHIELVFNIISTGKTNSVTVKRKISSGNLEADLLAMRYISHYLFVQQAVFVPNKWQTVKIDLSAKND